MVSEEEASGKAKEIYDEIKSDSELTSYPISTR